MNFIFFLEYCEFSHFGRQYDAFGRQSNLVLKRRQYRPNGGKVAAMFSCIIAVYAVTKSL